MICLKFGLILVKPKFIAVKIMFFSLQPKYLQSKHLSS